MFSDTSQLFLHRTPSGRSYRLEKTKTMTMRRIIIIIQNIATVYNNDGDKNE